MRIFLPLAETVRRSNQLLDPTRFLNWFDDYILGFILLFGAYAVKQRMTKAHSYLTTAWGIGVGALGLSFIAQLEHFWQGTDDPGIFSTVLVAVVKAIILLYMLYGLYLAIQSTEHR